MKVPIRKTINGTEYWDTELKKSIFVPVGSKPNFEVTENPKSMIIGVDLSSGKDTTVINNQTADDQADGPITLFTDLTIKELRTYAKQNKIIIPNEIKTKDDIVAFLNDLLLNDSEPLEDDAE